VQGLVPDVSSATSTVTLPLACTASSLWASQGTSAAAVAEEQSPLQQHSSMGQHSLLHTSSRSCSCRQRCADVHYTTSASKLSPSFTAPKSSHRQHICRHHHSVQQSKRGPVSSCSSSSSRLSPLLQPSASRVCCRAARESNSNRKPDNQEFQVISLQAAVL
jgi:hypothetical protein